MAADPEGSAELKAFKCYYNNMKLYLNPSTMEGKFISVGLINGSIIGGGGAVFLPDHMKMEMMLKEVRDSIALNGPKNFGLLVQALKSVPSYRNLASQLYSKGLTVVARALYIIIYALEKHAELLDKLNISTIDVNTAEGL